MWMVRSAVGGRLADAYHDQGVAGIGWGDLGDLDQFKDKSAMLFAIETQWPDWRPGKQQSSASQLYRFKTELAKGDRVITYDSSRRIYHVGTIVGECRHVADNPDPMQNVRDVEWEGVVDRDVLSVPARNKLGPALTLFQVPEPAAKEIEDVLSGEGSSAAEGDIESEEPEDEEILLEQYESQAFEIIKDRVNRLDWDELQELVAGLLRAMGYKTRVSPPGPDRGRDVMASPDGFGFESPRIIVEVKHRSQTTIGSQHIRSFLGGRHKDDKGLYVSTGGFTKEARYEADRANIPLTLMDIDDLVMGIFDVYEKMDLETHKLLPLKRICWPA